MTTRRQKVAQWITRSSSQTQVTGARSNARDTPPPHSPRSQSPGLRRAVTSLPSDDGTLSSQTASRLRAESAPGPQYTGAEGQGSLPSIRIIPSLEHNSPRPPLYFAPLERKGNGSKVSVGRFSEKQGSESRSWITFKSKVVSRMHAEIWNEGMQWFIKDCKSSSGTFLNHIRLSSPGAESRAFAVKDGDVIQLGIDFRGGAEEIYRCVKIRCELNGSWKKNVNQFNVITHKHVREMSLNKGEQSLECAICLLHISPCQGLFVAPCSHCWHYKCIRPIIAQNYPQFLCPNCRSIADLEHEIDEIPEEIDEPTTVAAAVQPLNPLETMRIDDPNQTESDDFDPCGMRIPITPRATQRNDLRDGLLTPKITTGPYVFDNALAHTSSRSLSDDAIEQAPGPSEAMNASQRQMAVD